MALINTLRELHTCFGQPLTMARLRSVILLITRAHYGDPDNFGPLKDDLKCLKYDPENKEKGTMGIELGSVVDVKTAGILPPGIYIDFDGKCTWEKKVLNNLAGSSADNSVSNYAWLNRANIIVSHFSDSIDLSLTMAESTTSLFLGLRPHLMHMLDLNLLEVESLTFPKPSEKDVERYFQVDLNLSIVFNFNMSVNLESHRLKKFALELSDT